MGAVLLKRSVLALMPHDGRNRCAKETDGHSFKGIVVVPPKNRSEHPLECQTFLRETADGLVIMGTPTVPKRFAKLARRITERECAIFYANCASLKKLGANRILQVP